MEKLIKERINGFEIVSYENEYKTDNYELCKEWLHNNVVEIESINKKHTSYTIKHIVEKKIGAYVSNYDVKYAMCELGIKNWHRDSNDINYCYPISEKLFKQIEQRSGIVPGGTRTYVYKSKLYNDLEITIDDILEE